MVKITELPALTVPQPTDELAVVDNAGFITKRVTAGNLMANAYPVGSLYFNASSASNPSVLFGFGTWEAYATGRVLVGIDPAQSEFNVLGETGGAKTHTLSSAEMPAHSHTVNDPGHAHTVPFYGSNNEVVTNSRWVEWSTPVDNASFSTTSSTTGIWLNNAGGGASHNNLQPYITVFIWRRVA